MPKTDVQVPIDVVPGRKRRIGIMGGTFDPIHHGHLVAASEVLSVFNLDEVVFVPTGRQPYKRDRKVTLAEHRYLMAVIATASNPRFSVSRVDIERGGTTYTIDTLRDLRKAYPDADFFFITGADVLPQILEWKDSEDLWSMAHFVGVTRAGHYGSAPRGNYADGGPGHGDFFHGLPRARGFWRSAVVSSPRRRGSVHCQVSALQGGLTCGRPGEALGETPM